MVYICEQCQFMFERTGEVTNCPVCNSHHIRPADEAERAEYQKTREQTTK